MRLKDVSRTLNYDKNKKVIDRKINLRKRETDLKRDWGKKNYKPNKSRLLVVLFILSFLFFMVSILIAFYIRIAGIDNSVSSEKVSIVTQGAQLVDSGTPTPLTIRIANRNPVDIRSAKLIIAYPEGSFDSSGTIKRLVRQEKVFPVIPINDFVEYKIRPLFYGNESEVKTINYTLEYKLEGALSSFRISGDYDVSLRTSPISIDRPTFSSPVVGKDIDLTFRLTSNSVQPLDAVYLKVQYPIGFRPKQAFPDFYNPSEALWKETNLKPRESRNFQIRGTIVGEDGIQKGLAAEAFVAPTGVDQDAVSVGKASSVLTVQKSFLSSEISLRGVDDKLIASLGGRLSGTINWKNEDSDKLNDIVVVLSFSGAGLDESSIRSNAAYDGDRKTLTWDRISNPELESVSVGGNGRLDFDFSVLPNELDFVGANKRIVLSVYSEADRSSAGYRDSVSDLDVKEIKIRSEVQISSSTRFATGNLSNIGEIPPEVGKETSYTLSYFIKNNGNDLTEFKLLIPLSSSVKFNNEVYGLNERNYVYSEKDREIVVTLPIISGTNVDSNRSIEFQVIVKPNKSDVGAELDLTRGASFEARDSFTGEIYEGNLRKLTTRLDLEPSSSGSKNVSEAK